MKRGTTMLAAFAVVWALALPSWAQVETAPDTDHHHRGHHRDDRSGQARHEHQDGRRQVRRRQRARERQALFRAQGGDKIKATYNNNVIVRVKPAGEAAVDTVDKAYAKEQKSGTAVMVRRMTASIVDIDKSASSISFEGPNGWKYSRRVVDPKVFDQVKVGDKVDIIWSTDLTVAVE